MAASKAGKRSKPPAGPKQELAAKIFHGLNIISLILMIGSGLQIYNANPVFGGRGGWTFPRTFLLGGWLGGGRNWHFAAMWLFALNLLVYGVYIFSTKRWEKRFVSQGDLQVLQKGQNPKRKNYAWHRLIYTGIVPVLILAIASGVAMYKPAQLHWLSGLFGSWQTLRVIHFITVPIVIIFVIGHFLLSQKVGGYRLIKSMFT
ncbi:cytochrome b/b6 domain-containing protein [Nostoc sp. FACHB-87]|uniref:cytochrome b/b6 domain-containing protein n=1 Tax=Nostocales TaxID=1161 RepID=UPI00168843B9|nr:MULTISPECIES: cytochrome b/b6 domain-containing protein [Nostocales]MBD2454987.1 cytochrome b/b6 domain-containing protein [Nostoc sp. FACHB-87]MBD2474692.1 cytochrome b/b6 domain-containing protein [Anabaena sp. FACHB-83]MBD2488036.1 cytochrome b/b6 domain-containing protein [Aulosira sp. FACHB-615]